MWYDNACMLITDIVASRKENALAEYLEHELSVATQTARIAGSYLMSRLGSAKVEYAKAAHDDLLDTDLGAEHILISAFREAFPSDGILSEEAGRSGSEDRYWIIDPLDGSANFQHGFPIFATNIALSVQGTTVLGVTYVPARDELFAARQGTDVTLNGQPCHVSAIQHLDEALILIGEIPRRSDNDYQQQAAFQLGQLNRRARRLRQIGTTATELAYVASGKADALVHRGAYPWDIEAGTLMVLEAGGVYSSRLMATGETFTVYSTPAIHAEIWEALLNTDAQ